MEQLIVNPSDFGIEPDTDKDLGGNFLKLFEYVSTLKTPSFLKLKEGVYHIDALSVEKVKIRITNTASEKEIKEQIHAFALYLKNIKDFELDGSDAQIILENLMTGICISECENVLISNLKIDYRHPSLFEVTVKENSGFSAVLSVSQSSPYKIEKGKLYSLGAGQNKNLFKNIKSSCNIRFDSMRAVRTSKTPFSRCIKIKELEKNLLKAYYFPRSIVKANETYALGDNVRREVGVFLNDSKNVTVKNLKQYFNSSHGIVSQCSKNLFFKNLFFAPKDQTRKLASHTDFLHFNMCRGKISVENSVFSGANDDCVNVHGVFFKIKSIHKNKLICTFCHDQTFGFDPFKKGDIVRFFDTGTLLQKEKATVVSSVLLNEYDIELTLSGEPSEKVVAGMGLDDESAQPDFDFKANDISFVTTRGVLCTTSGKVVIQKNNFNKTSMAGIFISDDCANWYESSFVTDVTISENLFDNCLDSAILIKPENRVYKGPVHTNVKILNNKFLLAKDTFAVKASSSDFITVKDNEIHSEKDVPFLFTNCKGVVIENNTIE